MVNIYIYIYITTKKFAVERNPFVQVRVPSALSLSQSKVHLSRPVQVQGRAIARSKLPAKKGDPSAKAPLRDGHVRSKGSSAARAIEILKEWP